MNISKEQQEKFEDLCDSLIKWLNDNTNPHTKILIDSHSAELLFGELGFVTTAHIKD